MNTCDSGAKIVNQAFVDYYRCPSQFARMAVQGTLSEESGYFQFGHGVLCYGRTAGAPCAGPPVKPANDLLGKAEISNSTLWVPFDPTEVVENLRLESYVVPGLEYGSVANKSLIWDTYYLLRPLMPISFRRHLQRIHLRGWSKIPFPAWPVDTTVEQIHRQLLQLLLRIHTQIPFVWFWPDGYSSCAMLTHDVETSEGLAFCESLMDLNDAHGIKSSFQIIPEGRYFTSDDLRQKIRDRGFEINIHDLNHDGQLFREQEEFYRRALRINDYGRASGAKGFRSGALFRNPDWYGALAFSYDMSIPNVAHLDPQRGGCCTVMPYLIGNILELPLTTTQDYSLFHILNDYSIELWKRQIDLVMQNNGLVSFNVHPDYIIEKRARRTYTALLEHLSQLRDAKKLWIALPGDVNRWWRQRREMTVRFENNAWNIYGPGAERARLAFARCREGQLIYSLEGSPLADLPPAIVPTERLPQKVCPPRSPR